MPSPGRRRGPDDRRAFEEGPGDQGPDVLLDQGEPGRVGQVALGQGDHAAGEAEQAEDLQVLAGLRHHRVVGRDDQHGQVEPGRAGQHVADEPLVARDVDQGELDGRPGRARRSPGRW